MSNETTLGHAQLIEPSIRYMFKEDTKVLYTTATYSHLWERHTNALEHITPNTTAGRRLNRYRWRKDFLFRSERVIRDETYYCYGRHAMTQEDKNKITAKLKDKSNTICSTALLNEAMDEVLKDDPQELRNSPLRWAKYVQQQDLYPRQDNKFLSLGVLDSLYNWSDK